MGIDIQFSDRFRGSQVDVSQRLEIYLPFMERLISSFPGMEAIDLGAGRGEWLRLMESRGWNVRGVDTSIEMVTLCQERGLDVVQGEAVSWLSSMRDDSVAAITGFHIAEHLSYDELTTLLKEACRVLVPGGGLLLETPNPENPRVGLLDFHLDPTHHKPLPPVLFQFLAEQCGFDKPGIIRVNGPNPPNHKADLVDNIEWFLSAYPDYALIAAKPTEGEVASPLAGLPEELTANQVSREEPFVACLKSYEEEHRALQRQLKSYEDLFQRQLQEVMHERHQLESDLSALYSSRSWRLTYPLRCLAGATRNRLGSSSNRMSATPRASEARGGALLRRLADVHWLKRVVVPALDLVPPVKRRLHKRMMGTTAQWIERRYQRDLDFIDLRPHRVAEVREESLAMRDALLPPARIEASLKALLLEGHVNGSYSLASVNRHLLWRLSSDCSCLALQLIPREGDREFGVRETPGGKKENQWLESLTDSSSVLQFPTAERVALYHHFPIVSSPDPDDGLPVALFFWEETIVPAAMVQSLNSFYKGVLVTSWFVKKALMDSGCTLPIHIVTLPLRKHSGAEGSQLDDLGRVAESGRINLLHVSSCFPRKGVDILLEAFDQLVVSRPMVNLTIKTFPNPHNQVEALIEQLVRPAHRKNISLIMEDYDAEQMAELYHQADLVVLPSRGEGLNMPALEAGIFSRPLLVTGFGAHTDFAGRDNSWWIGYRFDYAQSHFADTAGGERSLWVEPGVKSLVDSLEELCSRLMTGQKDIMDHAGHLYQQVHQRFLSTTACESVRSALVRLQHYSACKKASSALSISLCTTWGEPCGIAEYSAHLVEPLISLGHEVKVLAPQGRVDHNKVRHPERIHEYWRMGSVPDLRWIEPDCNVIWLQHHFAFYALKTSLVEQVLRLRDQGKLIYITLHTTRALLDFEDQYQREACDVLLSLDRIFVHTLDDLNTLKRLGVTDNVTLMRQGVDVPELVSSEEPDMEDNEAPLLGSFGFLLPHKGIYELIEAFADLRDSDRLASAARLRLVTSVRDDDISRQELARCRELAEVREIASNIDWYTDYLPLDKVRSLLAECQLLVLPYQFTQESSSAAVRTAVACCPDVATTPSPIFEEVRSLTWPLPGFTTQDIAQGITTTLAAKKSEEAVKLHESRENWIEATRWETIAAHYSALFEAALVDKNFIQQTLD